MNPLIEIVNFGFRSYLVEKQFRSYLVEKQSIKNYEQPIHHNKKLINSNKQSINYNFLTMTPTIKSNQLNLRNSKCDFYKFWPKIMQSTDLNNQSDQIFFSVNQHHKKAIY